MLGLLSRSGFVHSIRESGANVNIKLENVTNSKQFKHWFGDWEDRPKKASKVVNPDGTPKTVYYGTDKTITKFDVSSSGAGDNAKLGKGIYAFNEDSKKLYKIKMSIAKAIEGRNILYNLYVNENGSAERTGGRLADTNGQHTPNNGRVTNNQQKKRFLPEGTSGNSNRPVIRYASASLINGSEQNKPTSANSRQPQIDLSDTKTVKQFTTAANESIRKNNEKNRAKV